MNSMFKGQAVKNLVGGYYHMEADGTIIYLSNQTPPTKKEINDEIAKLQAEHDANQYQRDRASQYPSIQDQLDMQYHDAIDGTTTWKDAVAKVKADNPKP